MEQDVLPAAPTAETTITVRAETLFQECRREVFLRTDRFFSVLMLLQWAGCIVAALLVSPHTWIGMQSHSPFPVLAAVFLGGGISLLPVWAARTRPGSVSTRHIIAVCQMLMSSLLICLTGGRIETHFHIFASLAFLACYRDWRVLVTATLVVITDHLLRGVYWPQSLFGTLAVSPGRALEHGSWVLFEVTILWLVNTQSVREMQSFATRQADQEAAETRLIDARDLLEYQVEARVEELTQSNVFLQQQIVEREQAEEAMRWQATHDALTRLPNRLLFQDRLEQAIAHGKRYHVRCAVLFLDLDRFKQVNDTLGHAVGDLLLMEVSARLSACLREEDTLARMGGDEFTILLPTLNQDEGASVAARRLLAALSPAMMLEGQELFLSGSIGISVFPQDGQDSATLLKQADSAMYQAKSLGSGTFQLWAQDMNAAAQERLHLDASLRRAVTGDEMVLAYQPQIEIATGEIRGVEALVRWNHPELGLVPPARFIPLAEETGLIVPLGQWILHEAASQAAAWYRQGRALRMSVNLSARQCELCDLPALVTQVLDETGLPAHLLELELTESAVMARGDSVVAMLNALKALGVHLAVDDFGTGYSSLAYLRRFPVDVLKIDRAFISDLEADDVDVAIVNAIVKLAHALGLAVVAEGVETVGQQHLLKTLGCDLMQGYLYSPALSPAQLETLLDEALINHAVSQARAA